MILRLYDPRPVNPRKLGFALLVLLGIAFAAVGAGARAAAPAQPGRADLGFDKKPANVYKKVEPGVGTLTGIANLTLRNHGPSAAAPVYVTFKVTAQFVQLRRQPGSCKAGPATAFLSDPGLALGKGYQASGGTGEIEIDCVIPRLTAKAVEPIVVVMSDLAPSGGFSQVTESLFWEVGPATVGIDPNFSNNEAQGSIVFCGESATSAGCKTASG